MNHSESLDKTLEVLRKHGVKEYRDGETSISFFENHQPLVMDNVLIDTDDPGLASEDDIRYASA